MAPTPLENGHREFAAGEEARLPAVVGQQIRFGEALKVARLPQGPDHGAHIEIRVEQEDVQEVAEHQVVGEHPAPETAASCLARSSFDSPGRR